MKAFGLQSVRMAKHSHKLKSDYSSNNFILDWAHRHKSMFFSVFLSVSSSGGLLPLQGGHGDNRLQTASPQAQVMTPAPRPPTPTQPPPQQQTAQQTTQPPHPQQPSLPPPHSHGQNGYSSNKHSQSQAAFHSEFICVPCMHIHGQKFPSTCIKHVYHGSLLFQLDLQLSCSCDGKNGT